jgi:hypothetical protein
MTVFKNQTECYWRNPKGEGEGVGGVSEAASTLQFMEESLKPFFCRVLIKRDEIGEKIECQ